MSNDGIQIAPEINIAYINQKCIGIEGVGVTHFQHDLERELFKHGGSRKAHAKRTHDEGQGSEVTNACAMSIDTEFQAT
jgi:hypothetical protein